MSASVLSVNSGGSPPVMFTKIRAVASAIPLRKIRAGPSTVTEGNGRACPTTHNEAQPERSTSRAFALVDSVDMKTRPPSRTK